MTNIEAINIINNKLNTYYCTDEDLQALDLAIKALKLYPIMLQPTDRDKAMINAMAFIKAYCKDINECLNCPMYDNCHSSDDNKRFPYFWYIPEV